MCAKAQGHETARGTQTQERFPYSGCGAISELRWMRGAGRPVLECELAGDFVQGLALDFAGSLGDG